MRLIFAAGALLALSGCAELHHKNGHFAASGYSANILFFQVPRDPMVLAAEKVPSGAAVTTVQAAPNDWHSLPGFFNRLLGVGRAQIAGTAK